MCSCFVLEFQFSWPLEALVVEFTWPLESLSLTGGFGLHPWVRDLTCSDGSNCVKTTKETELMATL